jgi:hypothetical protein
MEHGMIVLTPPILVCHINLLSLAIQVATTPVEITLQGTIPGAITRAETTLEAIIQEETAPSMTHIV